MESPNRHPLKGYIEGHLKKQAGLEKFVKNEKTFYLQWTKERWEYNLLVLKSRGKKILRKTFQKTDKGYILM